MGRLFWAIIGFAIILRLLLMPITYHSDIQPFDLAGYLFQSGVGANFYDYLPAQSSDSAILKVYPSNLFNYPPAVYFFLGSVDNVMTIFTPADIREVFLFNVKDSFGKLVTNLHLFSLKLVYIPFDIGIAWLLWRLVEKKFRLIVLSLWLFNPVVLFGIYMMGQFDVIPAFFTVLAIYLVKVNGSNRNIWFSAICLGLGAAFKIYPILLLPVLASLNISWRHRVGILIVGFGVYVLSISPFLLSSGFRSTALVAGQTMKSLYAQIPLSGGESVLLYIATLICVYLLFFVKTAERNQLGERMMIIMMIFFMFTHFHPQWFLWTVPFLILNIVNTNFKSVLGQIVIYLAWFAGLWFFDSGMTIGLFAPIWPNLYNGQSIWELVGYQVDVNFARSLIASVFFGGGLFLIVLSFWNFDKKLENHK